MKKATKTVIVSSIILLLFLLTTNPQNLPSALLVLPFICIFIIVALGVRVLLAGRLSPKQGRLKVAAVVACVPVSLLVLQSLGQLTPRDALAIISLFTIAYFYMSRVGKQSAGHS